jgi:hypothetical protein
MEVDRRHVVKLQGKDFITYDGLLDMAHQMGLVSIKTEMISFENGVVIFKATAKTETQEFDGYGDTDDSNVNKMIARHKIRMAETRAKARALRDLTNVGMCSVEEMGGDDTDRHGNSVVYDEDETVEITPEDVPDSFNRAKELFDGKQTEKPPAFISDAQQKRLFALAGYKENKELAKENVQKLLNEYGLAGTGEIKKGKEYDEICEKAELMLANSIASE